MLDAWPVNILLGFLYVPFFVIQLKRRTSLVNHLLYLSFFIFVNAVIALTLFPLPVQKELIRDMAKENYVRNSFVPFKDILSTLIPPRDLFSGDIPRRIAIDLYVTSIYRNIFGNIIMFAPLGFLVPLIFKQIDSLKRILLVGFLSSLAIESLQGSIGMIIGLRYKTVSVDDLILNTTGAVVGFLALRFAAPAINNILPQKITPSWSKRKSAPEII